MVRFEVEFSASVRGFSLNFGGQCPLFPDDQIIQRRIALSHSLYLVNGKKAINSCGG
jgi:hypothetical protein